MAVMKKRCFLVLSGLCLLAAALAPAAGCKEVTCERVCEDRNECEGAMVNPDCDASCNAEIQSAKDAGCKDQFDSLIGCQGGLSVCSADTLCTAQSAAYVKCLSDACSKDPSTCSGS